ncbi:hypothetical protein BDN70DRAFT_933279 [Pholiota conissans]|uniref:Pali-domain-containing protein n=1 Tax=Pholiota conissans TaxID=109636 RepID=A0A9P6D0E6_9AGAR|nr:hypothetical protein BDN70DRAFT_933279 [Pholiota conissans]
MSRSIPALVLIFIALVLSFFVSISLPFILGIDIARINVEVPGLDGKGDVRLGIWSYCIYDLTGAHACAPKGLGYSFEKFNAFNVNESDVLSSAWTRGLILHPIATGFIFVAFVTSLLTSTLVNLVAFLATLFAAFVTLIAFVIDIALYVHIHTVVKDAHVDAVANTDTAPGFWLSFVSVVLLIAASVAFFFGRRGERRSSQSTSYPLQSSKSWAEKFASM